MQLCSSRKLTCFLDIKGYKKCVSGVQVLAPMTSRKGLIPIFWSHLDLSDVSFTGQFFRLLRVVLTHILPGSFSHCISHFFYFHTVFATFLHSFQNFHPCPPSFHLPFNRCSVRMFIEPLDKQQTVFKWVSENMTWSPYQKYNLWFFLCDLCQDKFVYTDWCSPQKRDGWKPENREHKCDIMIYNKKYMLGLCPPVPGTKPLKPL